MRRTTSAALAGLLLTTSLLATPASAQAPNVQQLLQGLLSGDQNQDKALRDAFDRGYQRGREDEGRRLRSDRGRSDRIGQDRRRPRERDADEREDGEYGVDRRSSRDDRRSDPPYGQQGGPYRER